MDGAGLDEGILIPVHHVSQPWRSHRERILEMSFAKLWIIVIGVKSDGQLAQTFFGRSAIRALFSRSMLLLFPCSNACTASMTSSWMTGQAVL
jgi:hypothetical protein